jgi:hypothetical protein
VKKFKCHRPMAVKFENGKCQELAKSRDGLSTNIIGEKSQR